MAELKGRLKHDPQKERFYEEHYPKNNWWYVVCYGSIVGSPICSVISDGSDFETPAPGQTAAELLSSGIPGFAIATENEYRVGSKIAQALVTKEIAG